MDIRPATPGDRDAIRGVCLRAFPKNECEVVAALAVELFDHASEPPTLTIVADVDDRVAGIVVFSPVMIEATSELAGYILAPLAVDPTAHGRGIGSTLVRSGIAQLEASGIRVFFVYGDPGYYARFGFSGEAATGYAPPYPLEYPQGWQAIAPEPAHGAAIKVACAAPLCDPALW